MNRINASLVAGGIASVLTLTIPLWPERPVVALLGVPLTFGVVVASVTFGGLHNAPPIAPLTVLASILNGVIWVGIIRAVCGLRDVVRVLRS